jgi:mersacidin/lichenicidin family type 2 lantibiotic
MFDIIRAWKDPEYRYSLSAAERAMLPAHPAGPTELTAEQILAVSGGDCGGYNPPPPPAPLFDFRPYEGMGDAYAAEQHYDEAAGVCWQGNTCG